MADLIAKLPHDSATGAADGPRKLLLAPFGAEEVDPGPLTSLMPYLGKANALSEALNAAHGMTLPKANRMTGKAGAQVLWFGRSTWLLIGAAPDPALAENAAVTDQSDAWATIRLAGPGIEDVLARTTPLDLAPQVFKRGHTARSQIGHLNASITRTGADSFRLMVFRSMVVTLFDELNHAMIAVSSRRELL